MSMPGNSEMMHSGILVYTVYCMTLTIVLLSPGDNEAEESDEEKTRHHREVQT